MGYFINILVSYAYNCEATYQELLRCTAQFHLFLLVTIYLLGLPFLLPTTEALLHLFICLMPCFLTWNIVNILCTIHFVPAFVAVL